MLSTEKLHKMITKKILRQWLMGVYATTVKGIELKEFSDITKLNVFSKEEALKSSKFADEIMEFLVTHDLLKEENQKEVLGDFLGWLFENDYLNIKNVDNGMAEKYLEHLKTKK